MAGRASRATGEGGPSGRHTGSPTSRMTGREAAQHRAALCSIPSSQPVRFLRRALRSVGSALLPPPPPPPNTRREVAIRHTPRRQSRVEGFRHILTALICLRLSRIQHCRTMPDDLNNAIKMQFQLFVSICEKWRRWENAWRRTYNGSIMDGENFRDQNMDAGIFRDQNMDAGIFRDQLYVEEDSVIKFLENPDLWIFYRQGWADYHAYTGWPSGTRTRLQPLKPSHNGRRLPPSPTFVLNFTEAQQERAMCRTAYILRHTQDYLLNVMSDHHVNMIAGNLWLTYPELMDAYLRGWIDHESSFRLVASVMAPGGAEVVVPTGTFLAPVQHIIVPESLELPNYDHRTNVFTSHSLFTLPECKVIVELGPIDDAEFNRVLGCDYMIMENANIAVQLDHTYCRKESPVECESSNEGLPENLDADE